MKIGRGQLDISFGMIFSILIIIAIVATAVYVIMHFLTLGNCSEVGFFYKDLSDEANKAWNSPTYKGYFEGSVPSKINEVCFGNLSDYRGNSYDKEYDYLTIHASKNKNVFFYPPQSACDSSLNSYYLQHAKFEGFFCIEVDNSKAKVYLAKGTGDSLVNVCSSQSSCTIKDANSNSNLVSPVVNNGASEGFSLDNETGTNGKNGTNSAILNAYCTDSDGGKDYYVKGSVHAEPYDYSVEDECNDEGLLIERYCDVNSPKDTAGISCPTGCANGQCNALYAIGHQCSSNDQCVRGAYCKQSNTWGMFGMFGTSKKCTSING